MNEMPSPPQPNDTATPIHRGLDGVLVDYTTICEIDDVDNKLRYRGYDLEELVDNVPFTDVVFLLLHGELPTHLERSQLLTDLDRNRYLPTAVSRIIDLLPLQTSPMSVLRTAVSAIGCCEIDNAAKSDLRSDAVRLLAQVPLAVGRFRARLHGTDSPEAKSASHMLRPCCRNLSASR